MLLALIALGALVCLTLQALPSRTIRIAAGPVGGSFYETALEYRKIVERQGFRLEIVPFQNTDEIGAHVANPNQHLDVGFVAGDQGGNDSAHLISLGDIQLQPIFIFETRQAATTHPVKSFSDLRETTLVLPPQRSLTSRMLLSIFALNGFDKGHKTITYMPLDDGIARLKRGDFDVGLFILGADSEWMANLAKDEDLVMVDPALQQAISKKLPYLRQVTLPAGIFDFVGQVPAQNVHMLAATISVVARHDLPPATIYAVLEAMREVHRKSSSVNRADEFPRYSSNLGSTEDLVDDFYRKGMPWAYTHFPIWIASVIDTYLAWLLALWVVASAFKVISELEPLRRYAIVVFARVVLWWVRRKNARGEALSGRTRAAIGAIQTSIEKEEHGIHDLLIALREAVGDSEPNTKTAAHHKA